MRLKAKPQTSAATQRRRIGWILWLIVALPVAWFSLERVNTAQTASVAEATVLDCAGSWVTRRSGSSRSMELRHKPIAYTEDGVKAQGSILLSHQWCTQMLGSKVAVATTADAKPAFISFVQFWALPSIGWYIVGAWLLALLGTRAPLLITFNVGYFASVGVLAYAELFPETRPDKAEDPAAYVLALCLERETLTQKAPSADALESFRCQSEFVDDLSSLPSMPKLEKLYLQGSSLESLASAPALPALKVISIAGSDTVTSVRGIERFTQLEELQANNTKLDDLRGIEQLPRLRIVAFMYANLDDADLTVFKDAAALEDVLFNYNADISDLSAFANKPALVELQAYSTRITDVTALYGNTAMKLVGVRGRAQIPCEQIEELKRRLAADARVFGPRGC